MMSPEQQALLELILFLLRRIKLQLTAQEVAAIKTALVRSGVQPPVLPSTKAIAVIDPAWDPLA